MPYGSLRCQPPSRLPFTSFSQRTIAFHCPQSPPLLTNPTSLSPTSPIPSTRSPSISHFVGLLSRNGRSPSIPPIGSTSDFMRARWPLRLLSSFSPGSPLCKSAMNPANREGFEVGSCGEDGSSDLEAGYGGNKPNTTRRRNREIVEAIMRDEKDMEFWLTSVGKDLRKSDVFSILQALNRIGAPALRFFCWIRLSRPRFFVHDVCNLVIDNCGRLKKYDTMLLLLEDFGSRGICLCDKAFGFVAGLYPPEVMASEVERVVSILLEVRGPCGSSGIHSLLRRLCNLDFFPTAKIVIEMTGRRLSCYKMLMRGLCRRGLVEDAKHVLGEMRAVGCDPDADVYNYLISGCARKPDGDTLARQLFNEMLEYGLSPNAVTFEMLILQSCSSGNVEHAVGLCEEMESRGIQARSSTHAVLINHYFDSGLYEKAYYYVVESGLKDEFSASKMYSLLASRHWKKGNVLVAHHVLLQMMKKHLLPDRPVYRRVLKELQGHVASEENLARDMEATFRGVANIG